MGTFYSIPLLPGTPQKFTTVLSGITYTMTLQYRNNVMGGWVLDIADQYGKAILSGVPLVTGANLLKQYAYLGFTGSLWVQTTTNPDAVPTYLNLGADGQLYYVTNP